MEETAGMCFSGEKAVGKEGGPWRDRRENGQRQQREREAED